jgi:pimeloyl-ACP methyl ester carboxylesterase
VFITGGPGQAATESYVSIRFAFRRINEDRDVVLVDQRGTGGSSPLRCPSDETPDVSLLDDEEVGPWVARCLESLDGDPRFYTTSLAVEDLDAVREALGYGRVDLYGVSYGTRVALTYLRRFPDRVRAVVLDGVVPPEEVLGVDVARDAQRALDLLVERCAADEACSERFPNLGGALDDVVARLGEPVPVTLRHPRTGDEERLELDRSKAAYAIRLLSYSQETASLVPLLLEGAARGDLAPLAAQFLMTTGQVGETMSDAMGLSVVCTEDYPLLERDVADARSRDTYLGALQTESLELVCPSWPRGEVPPDFREPVRSEAPVLLLSGEADPVTPPENAAAVAKYLPNSLSVVAPGQGHVVIHRGCIPELAERLLETGSVAGPDAGCVSAIEPQAFFVSFNGPEP